MTFAKTDSLVCEVCTSGTTEIVTFNLGGDNVEACRGCWQDYLDAEYIEGDLDDEAKFLGFW